MPQRRRELGNLPHKVSADGAEGGLVEEDGRELVAPHHMDFGLLESSSPPVQRGDSVLGHRLYRLLTLHCGDEGEPRSQTQKGVFSGGLSSQTSDVTQTLILSISQKLLYMCSLGKSQQMTKKKKQKKIQ